MPIAAQNKSRPLRTIASVTPAASVNFRIFETLPVPASVNSHAQRNELERHGDNAIH